MIAQVRKFVGLSILLIAAGCAVQERKPAYDGWSLLATMPVANSEIAVAELAGKDLCHRRLSLGSENSCYRADV